MDNYQKLQNSITYLYKQNSASHNYFMNMQKELRPFLDPRNQVNEIIRKNSLAIQESIKLALQPLRDIQEMIINLAAQLIIEIPSIPYIGAFLKEFESLPEKMKTALLNLAKEGWFFDMEMEISALWEMEKTLDDGDSEIVEAILVEYFEKNLNYIQERIFKVCSHRKDILKQVFDTHRKGYYAASVALSMTQIDGICYEKIGGHYFMRKDRKPKTAKYVDSLPEGDFLKILMAPLSVSLPIHASEGERDENFSHMNRHMILHGESIDYGTKINSLKAISMLNYISQILFDDEEESTKSTEY